MRGRAMDEALQDSPEAPVQNAQPLGSWGFIALALACSTLSYMDRQVISLMVGPLKAALHLSDTEVGLAQGIAFSLCYAIGGLPLAFLIDKGNRVKVGAACVAVWSLATGACGLAGSLASFLLARAGTAVAEAGFSPAVLSMIPDIFARNRVARAGAIFLMGPPLGTGLALVGGGWLLGHFSESGGLTLPLVGQLAPWQSVFVCLTLPGLVLAGLLLVLVRDPGRRQVHRIEAAPRRPDSRWGVVEIWRSGFLLPFMLGTTLLMTASFALSAWAPTYFERHFGVPAHDAGKMLGPIFIVCSFAGALVTSILSGGGAPERTLQRVLAIVLTGAAFAGPIVIGLTQAPSLPVALVLYGAAALALNVVASLATAPIVLVVPNNVRAQAITVGGFILAVIGGGGGPFLVGLFTDQLFGEAGVGQSIALTAGIVWLAGLACLLVSRRALVRRG
jgi:MFS family permease